MKRIYMLLATLFLCLVLVISFLTRNKQSTTTNLPLQIETLETIEEETQKPQTSVASQTENTSIKGQKKFTSTRLGISFLFSATQNKKPITVTESDNTIQILLDTKPIHTIKVYEKKTKISLENSIKQAFFSNKDSTKCDILATPTTSSDKRFPINSVSARISYPDIKELSTKGNIFKNISEREKYCGEQFATSLGSQYFLYNPKTPNKYLHLVSDFQLYAPVSPESPIPFSNTINIF